MKALAAIPTLAALAAFAALAGCAAAPPADNAALAKQVTDTERAFADTMARRDFDAFGRFLAEEAVFYTAPQPLRGKAAILKFWKRDFEGPQAPFSWAPDRVDVLPSGTLAHSSGPVRDQHGKLIGRFSSVWRLEAPGQWKVVFDSGEELCECRGPSRP